MIRLAFAFGKLAVLAVVTLLVSQIQVGNARICDHVRNITQSAIVQAPIQWVSARFDFTGENPYSAKMEKADREAIKHRTAGSDRDESDKALLSGLLKRLSTSQKASE